MGGDCNDSAGCQDAEPLDNTDVCYVDIKDSFLASHTEDGYVVYPGDSEGNVNCMGFTWTDNEDDPANLYKGNLLFEVAMRYGLKENGYTRSVPHAPMCACVEQMPVVSKAACKDVENIDNWSFAPDEDSGLLNLWHRLILPLMIAVVKTLLLSMKVPTAHRYLIVSLVIAQQLKRLFSTTRAMQ